MSIRASASQGEVLVLDSQEDRGQDRNAGGAEREVRDGEALPGAASAEAPRRFAGTLPMINDDELRKGWGGTVAP